MEMLSLLFSIGFIIIIIIQSGKITNIQNQQERLRRKLQDLTDLIGEMNGLDASIPRSETAEAHEARLESESESVSGEDRFSGYGRAEEPESASPSVNKSETPFRKAAEKVLPEPSKLRDLLDLLLKNWIGIIGTVVLVLGFGFLGTFVAFGLSEFGRFALFLGSSIVIAAASFALESKLKIHKTALWLRSASGAIFLFACIGSTGIPGFIWIDNQIAGLMLLIMGVAANLALGHISGYQIIASVHVFLSLLAISLAPAALPPFLVALVVVLYGLYLTYRKKWDINFLTILCLFFIYHLIWHFQLRGSGIAALSLSDQASALFAVSLVFLLSLMAHYRHVYGQKKFETIPFLTHFLNWIFFGNGIYLYRDLIPLKFILLAAGSLVAYFIARKGKTLEIRWLFITDALASNLLMILALVSLYPRGVSWYYISLIVLLESVAFLIVSVLEKERLLTSIAYFIVLAAGIGTVISAIFLLDDLKFPRAASSAMGAALAVSASLYGLFSRRQKLLRRVDRTMSGSITIFMPLQVIMIFLLTGDSDAAFLSVLLMIPLVLIKDRFKVPALAVSVKIAALILMVLTFFHSESFMNTGLLIRILYYLPMAALFVSMARFSRIIVHRKRGKATARVPGAEAQSRSPSFGLYLLNLFVIIQSLIFFHSESEYVIGMVVFALSVTNLELGKAFPSWRRPLGHISFFQMLLFLIIHFSINQELAGHLWLNIQALALPLYWLFRKGSAFHRESRLFKFLFRHILELLYAAVIAIVTIEVEPEWQPVIWIGLSVLSLFYSWRKRPDLNRIRLYSVFLAWAAAVQLCLVLGIERGSPIPGAIVIALNILYLLLFKSKARLDDMRDKPGFKLISRVSHSIHKKSNLWIFYPFFAALALYILFRFNRSIITLMFVLESLTVFLLSLKLRENSFRIISMAGVAGSLLRLIFFDLNNSGTVLRALVFIGMGVVMVVMNVIYSRSRKDISDDPDSAR